jgi:Fe-S oxidoreductase
VGSRFAPLSNIVAQSGLGRWVNEKLLHIDRRRMPPSFARETFAQRFAKRSAINPQSAIRDPQSIRNPQSAIRNTVLLFNDTFTNYNHPEVGVAAAEVLAAAGIGIRLAAHGCCGRPLISQGLLDEARQAAQATTDALFDAATRGERVVFLEPSCLSAVREDAPALLRGDAQRRARKVADACVLFEDYLEREWQAGRIHMNLQPGPSTVLLHGHCHQKAMALMPPARALLGRIPSCTVVDLDAGCCGMAGSFGYAREHYEVSRQIGERKLLPAARAMAPGGVLVAAGVSCRQQVAHFTGVHAQHPAELLASLLDVRERRAR